MRADDLHHEGAVTSVQPGNASQHTDSRMEDSSQHRTGQQSRKKRKTTLHHTSQVFYKNSNSTGKASSSLLWGSDYSSTTSLSETSSSESESDERYVDCSSEYTSITNTSTDAIQAHQTSWTLGAEETVDRYKDSAYKPRLQCARSKAIVKTCARERLQESTALPPRTFVRKFDWVKLVQEVQESRRRPSLQDDPETSVLNVWRRLTPVSRFRAVVRMVLVNLAWFGDDDDEEQLNVLLLRREADPSPLTPDVKAILRRPAHMRTDAERGQLRRAVGRLNCFRRYPGDVQHQLAENTYYVMYGPGRVIVRQGDEAQALYFIVSGQVRVTVSHWDDVKQEMVEQEVAEPYGPGATFGEVSLLHGVARTATCTTATACELLYLERDDFSRVLKATLQQQWDDCKRAMALFPYFDGWDDIVVRESCILSQVTRYRDEELVLGDGAGQPECVYFVVGGECRLLQDLELKARRPKDAPHRIFMQVCSLRKGAVFNLGENLERRRVVAARDTCCLMIPCHWLMQHNRERWMEVREVLQHTIPTQQEVDAAFFQHRRWLHYRRRLVEKAVAGRRVPQPAASLHHVPYSIRIHSADVLH